MPGKSLYKRILCTLESNLFILIKYRSLLYSFNKNSNCIYFKLPKVIGIWFVTVDNLKYFSINHKNIPSLFHAYILFTQNYLKPF